MLLHTLHLIEHTPVLFSYPALSTVPDSNTRIPALPGTWHCVRNATI